MTRKVYKTLLADDAGAGRAADMVNAMLHAIAGSAQGRA